MHLDLRTQQVTIDGSQIVVHQPHGVVAIISNSTPPIQGDLLVKVPRDGLSAAERRWLYGTEGNPRDLIARDELIEVTLTMKVPASCLALTTKP